MHILKKFSFSLLCCLAQYLHAQEKQETLTILLPDTQLLSKSPIFEYIRAQIQMSYVPLESHKTRNYLGTSLKDEDGHWC